MNRLEQKLIEHEGLRLKLYKCSMGKWTVGVGRNIESNGISTEEAMFLLKNDILAATKEASKYAWFKGLDDVRQEVVILMIFQLGAKTFATFKKAIDAISRGDFDAAAWEMIKSSWHQQTPRRCEEMAQVMRNGKY